MTTEPTQAMREIEKAIDVFMEAAKDCTFQAELGVRDRYISARRKQDQARARLLRLIEEAMK